MTIDEKIKQAAEENYKSIPWQFVNNQSFHSVHRNAFSAGAEAMKSEMLADMQKMAESLEDIINDLNNICGCSYDEQCTACFLKEKYENPLAQFNEKYKGKK